VSVDDMYGPSLAQAEIDEWVDAPVVPRQAFVSLVRAVTYAAVLAGSALFGIWLYQTHISDFLTQRAQERLERSLPVYGSDVAGPDWQSPIVAADGTTAPPPPPGVVTAGTAVGRIAAPSIGLDYTIVAGVGAEELRSGPGWMQNTAFPGQVGNSVLSGHRTTHGAPFKELDGLVVGDRVTVSIPGRPDAVFEVRDIYVVAPTAVWVAAPTEGVRLTLTTCHPEGSDTERLVVQAELVEGENVAVAVPANVWQRSQNI
jgi:sortase A